MLKKHNIKKLNGADRNVTSISKFSVTDIKFRPQDKFLYDHLFDKWRDYQLNNQALSRDFVR